MEEVKIICLTPVKNESWIIESFLREASTWADHIIIADQNSNDGSKEIYKKYKKVKVVNNDSQIFNEPERQKILINAARKIKGKKIFITLDADEILTKNSANKKEWEVIKKLQPGTIINFELVNLLPTKNKYWTSNLKPLGFVDDGSPHKGSQIHSTRIPTPKVKKLFYVESIKVMHLQYIDWNRMMSKHRWYQCWERINKPSKFPLAIYRQYHHMYSIKKTNFKTIPSDWISADLKKNIKIILSKESIYYWDKEVLMFILKYGAVNFSKVDIWDTDWNKVSAFYNLAQEKFFSDPRNKYEKMFFQYLKKSQYFANYLPMKMLDYFLKFLFK